MIGTRYRMLGLIGRGGMGEVYRADDLKLGQPVALKFLPCDVERDPDRFERFLTEVRMSLRVTHPNVCRVFDIGQIGGRNFLSMEYVDGEDLASLLRRIGRLPEDKAIEIARQLCAGLSAAHDEGVLLTLRPVASLVHAVRPAHASAPRVGGDPCGRAHADRAWCDRHRRVTRERAVRVRGGHLGIHDPRADRPGRRDHIVVCQHGVADVPLHVAAESADRHSIRFGKHCASPRMASCIPELWSTNH
jgi:hypothetical protein